MVSRCKFHLFGVSVCVLVSVIIADSPSSMASSYTILPDRPDPQPESRPTASRSSLIKILSGVFFSLLIVSCFVAVAFNQLSRSPPRGTPEVPSPVLSPAELDLIESLKKPTSASAAATTEVSEKPAEKPAPNRLSLFTEAEIAWERSAFHFRPDDNFISDPDGPLYHMGWYHLFYQYNPDSAVWGNITWAHSVSKDMINWLHLPIAMVPDKWYDIKGVMTGSATILPDGQIIMLYSGNAYDLSQLQCLATPKNVSDPLLIEWVKYENNPILMTPPGIGIKDFRDPSTAWLGPDGKYRMVMGSKHGTSGVTLVYHTTDFLNYELLDEVLHAVPGTGMWECVDLYPVSMTDSNGLDPAVNGPGIKHVLKESGDEDRHDWYAIGTYDPVNDKWYPDNPEMDVGHGLRYDYGKFYASKSFFDPVKQRRVLWGYVAETDTQDEDRTKGWANILNIPRTVVLDRKTGTNLLLWPIEETDTLRSKHHVEFNDVVLRPGSLVPLKLGSATQLDITATFEVDKDVLEATVEADVGFNCTTSAGAVGRGALGPFGIVVLADPSLTELTPIYFYIVKETDGSAKTYFCADEKRSSTLLDVGKWVYGSSVPVLHGEKYNMRLLVDHSIVESFAQGGRTVITSRVYPTKAIYDAAKVFLFNNATGISVKASVKIWQMSQAQSEPYPL